MPQSPQSRIMQNGSGWYWEVVTPERVVIARGVAENARSSHR